MNRSSSVYGLARLPEPPTDPSRAAIGYGPLGILGGAAVAALAGHDFAFLRPERKGHGTRERLEGVRGGPPWCAYVAAGSGRSPLWLDGVLDVVEVEGADEPCARLPRIAIDRSLLATTLDGSATLLTDGPYVRSSGEVRDFYFETLTAAHTFSVAAAFAEWVLQRVDEVDVVCGVMNGGVYLAAVVAAALGAEILALDPDGPVAPDDRFADASVLFVDDLVNSGTDFGRCASTAARARTRMFVALFGERPTKELVTGEIAAVASLLESPSSHD